LNISKSNNVDTERKKFLTYVVRVCLVVAMGGFLFGYDTAVISGAIGFLRTKFELDATLMGWMASSALVGCIIGCLFAGITSDKIGRKKTLILAAILYCPYSFPHPNLKTQNSPFQNGSILLYQR
jgi:SP family arabinose:H+ symporter-like MFS transporter